MWTPSEHDYTRIPGFHYEALPSAARYSLTRRPLLPLVKQHCPTFRRPLVKIRKEDMISVVHYRKGFVLPGNGQ